MSGRDFTIFSWQKAKTVLQNIRKKNSDLENLFVTIALKIQNFFLNFLQFSKFLENF